MHARSAGAPDRLKRPVGGIASCVAVESPFRRVRTVPGFPCRGVPANTLDHRTRIRSTQSGQLTGRRTMKRVSPGVDCTDTSPWCASTTIRRTISRPSPVPLPASLVVKNGSKIRETNSGRNAGTLITDLDDHRHRLRDAFGWRAARVPASRRSRYRSSSSTPGSAPPRSPEQVAGARRSRGRPEFRGGAYEPRTSSVFSMPSCTSTSCSGARSMYEYSLTAATSCEIRATESSTWSRRSDASTRRRDPVQPGAELHRSQAPSAALLSHASSNPDRRECGRQPPGVVHARDPSSQVPIASSASACSMAPCAGGRAGADRFAAAALARRATGQCQLGAREPADEILEAVDGRRRSAFARIAAAAGLFTSCAESRGEPTQRDQALALADGGFDALQALQVTVEEVLRARVTSRRATARVRWTAVGRNGSAAAPSRSLGSRSPRPTR